MNSNNLMKSYKMLTPQERFQLILAAGVRGDDVEQGRLTMAGGRIALSLQDHAPFALAFDEVAQATYLDLLEEAHRYLHAFDLASSDQDAQRKSLPDDNGDKTADDVQEPPARKGRRQQQPTADRYFDLALAAGFVLHTKVEGWKLFCQWLHVPPFALWQALPGFERLQGALSLAEKAAFVPEGFLRWMNRIRPAGQPVMTKVPFTRKAIARATKATFRSRVRWWDGSSGKTSPPSYSSPS